MNWIVLVVVLIIVGFILDREVYFYEGARLGPRIQSWLYDRWAKKYDAGKRESQGRDNEMLAQPLLEKLAGVSEPFLLDFATGTGRLSYALLSRADFHGRIIALDISQGMLEQANHKVHTLDQGNTTDGAPSARVEFLRYQSLPLPFPDAAFDVVCCLEVLELMPDAQAALHEMSRVLRPGGILLTSRGTEESGRKAKVKSKEEQTSLLERSGFENILITKWWKLFDRVFAMKKGSANAVGAKTLSDVLKCSSCGHIHWDRSTSNWTCEHCGSVLSVTNDNIVMS